MDFTERRLPSLAEPFLCKDTGEEHGEEWRAGIRVPAEMAENLRPLKIADGGLDRFASHEEQSGGILGVFVVSFDNNVGNTVDWYQTVWDSVRTPNSKGKIDTFLPNGLEFRALPSGIHNVDEDCLYFRHGTLFGIAAFHRMLITNPQYAKKERHARMRSVGALATSLVPLASCLPILSQAAARHPSPSSPLDTRVLSSLLNLKSRPPPLLPGPPSRNSPYMLPLPPSHIFADFMSELGVFAITLWKALLLRRRLLFFSRPPVSFSCDLVLATCALVHGITSFLPENNEREGLPVKSLKRLPLSLLPLFSIGLHDVDILSNSTFYVACTSEAILRHKQKLWDVLIEAKDGSWDFTIPSVEMREELRVTPADQARFHYLSGSKEISSSATCCASTMEQFPSCCCPPGQQVFNSAMESESLDRVAAMNATFLQALNSVTDRPSLSSGVTDLLRSTQMGRGDMKFLQALLQRTI